MCRNVLSHILPPPESCPSCSYSKMEKVTAELFCFTYGAMVSQLLRQYKDAAEVIAAAESTQLAAAVAAMTSPFFCFPTKQLQFAGYEMCSAFKMCFRSLCTLRRWAIPSASLCCLLVRVLR